MCTPNFGVIKNSYIHSIVLDSLLIPVEDLPIVWPFFRMPQTFEVGEIFFLCLKISGWMIFNHFCYLADDSSQLKLAGESNDNCKLENQMIIVNYK